MVARCVDPLLNGLVTDSVENVESVIDAGAANKQVRFVLGFLLFISERYQNCNALLTGFLDSSEYGHLDEVARTRRDKVGSP